MTTGPERRERRGGEIRQRLGAIRSRIEELQARRRDDDTSPAGVGERLALAQRHVAASQAAATNALLATVRALRKAAESHADAARQHERSAAAGFGDRDEHQRRAAIHQAAAETDSREAERARSRLPDKEADETHEPRPDRMLNGSLVRTARTRSVRDHLQAPAERAGVLAS